MTDSLPGYFKYWGKTDPKYEGEPKWHPLVYLCLDVAPAASQRRQMKVDDGQGIGKFLGENVQMGENVQDPL